MYVLVWTPSLGVHGWGWFWLALAVVLDLSHYSSAGYANRDRMPGYA
jgi:hypothetical protein